MTKYSDSMFGHYLKLYSDYTRKDVHDIFAPEAAYRENVGTWGYKEILALSKEPGQMIGTKSGDFIFFVTLGQSQEPHQFAKVITETGRMFWVSQPWMDLQTPQIQQFIQHDITQNNIFLFWRANKSNPYTYLGNLAPEWHDPTRESPVHICWKILEWAPKPNTLNRIGLHLISDSDEIALEDQLLQTTSESVSTYRERIKEPLEEPRKTSPVIAGTKFDGLGVPILDILKARLDQALNPLTHLEILVLALRLGLEDGREKSVQAIGEAFSLTDIQVETVIDAALKKMGRGSQFSEINRLMHISAELPRLIEPGTSETAELEWQGLGVLPAENRLDIQEEWTEIEIISELGVSVGQLTYLPVVKVRVLDDDTEKYWVLLGSSIKESLDPLRIENLGSLMGLVVGVRLNEQYNIEVSTASSTEHVCKKCGAIIPSGARIFYQGTNNIYEVDCQGVFPETESVEATVETHPTASFREPQLPIRRPDRPRIRWCVGCGRITEQIVLTVNGPLRLRCRLCNSVFTP